MATIAQQHLPDSPPSNTNSDTQATGRRIDGSERGEGEGRWLLYNEEYQLLICAFHGYAVRFHNLEGHLKDRHPDLSHQVRSDLIRRHKGLLPTLLEEGPREDQLARHGSSNPAEPVEGLPIHRGFACTWPGCGYLTPSWKCLHMHFNDEHNAKAAKRKTQADLWAAVHLQTFFTGPKRAICYFCVREVGRGEGEREEEGGSERRRRRGRGATTVTQPEDQMTIAHITKGWSLQQEEQEEMQKVMDEEEEVLLADHGFRFTLEQRANLEKLWAHLQGEEDEEIEGDDDEAGEDEIEGGRPSSSRHNSPNSDKGLQERMLRVLAGFWTQRLDGEPAVALRRRAGDRRRDGAAATSLPIHLCTRRSRLHRIGAVGGVRDAWLCKATYSPMGYILSLLLFGKKIARETGSRLMVSWSKQGEMIYFIGKPILMEDLRTMVAKMMADAEDLLWGQLMFKEGNDERFVIPLAGIEDDLTQTRRGQSFIHRNGLAGKEVEMLKDLITSSRKTDLLDQTGEWKWAGIRKYLKLVKRFEEFLLLLAHITGGQPSQGEEIIGLRLINGINRDCNIFIIDGEVVLVTQYYKSLAHFDSPKVIPRFLPGRIGQLFVIYMIYIWSLTDRWEADKWELYGEKMAPPSDFIWHNKAAGGVPWESSQMSAAMRSKKHACDRGAGWADFEDAANYGVMIDILKRLTAESLEIFRQAGKIGVKEKEKQEKEKNEEEEEEDMIIRALRAVLRNNNARFRSPQQEEAVSQAKCKALAYQLNCHYYHALRNDSNSQFIAQHKEGFQAWLRGKAPYIVATAALGTGIDVAGIIHVIHLEAPFSIIDYAQEAGRARRTGEPVTAEVIIKDKDWPDEDAAGEACLDISVREVRRLIRTRGCRRRLLGQCLDGDLRDCKDLGGDDEAKVIRCDNCHHDELAWKSELSAQISDASRERVGRTVNVSQQSGDDVC
ncbi:hypothetical protein FANTH_10012 [Fusarium anthophilum]|uniref:DNA 3'-5' helicase n=1 Tax=Fusarium anthophilum TaxID=48485 RepID=A0A8H4Z3M0_9HYPO|nr:hypothetical protein FANTH_10012 [Fusarium anthophilum]